jgi:hypothetical protein
MWDDGYPVLNEPDGAYRVRLRVQEPWMIAARADELDREIQERGTATLTSPKRRGLRWWLHWLRWKEL